ncbi:MAG: MbnP family protein [Chitinophagaceae bacterium]
MKKQLVLPVLLILLTAIFAGSCSKEYSASGFTKVTPEEDSFNLAINFIPMADTLKLRLDSACRNFWNEEYTVSAFKFYVSKVDLINTDSNRTYHVNSDKYFLVDAADSTTWTVKLLASPFTYNRISFLIGIDSARNISGTQTGALDPAKGMFWTLSSGYVMAKLEGKSALSSQPNNKIEYHIGGFSGENSVLRKPTLLFPFGQYLQITTTPGRKSFINVKADVNAWFSNPHQVKIKNTPACTSPGLMAKDISENYSKMFSVTGVINN